MKIKQLAILILALFLSHAIAAQDSVSGKTLSSMDVLTFDQSEEEYKEIQKELKQLEKQRTDLLELLEAFEAQQKAFVLRAEKLESTYDAINASAPAKRSGRGKTPAPAGDVTTQLKEMQMSFNMQYLQLQQQMQNENRSYTAISEIMKAKHDTAKNSVGNIR